MYRYDEFDRRFVAERTAEFRDQVNRRLDGSLTEDEFKPLRLMNGLYLQLHAYMLRVAIPYGTLDSRQMRMLAHIAEKWDRGYGHFTTRQNIQFNWPKLADTPDILDALASVEMHAIQTSGNCIRNTTSDPYSGVAPDEVEDPRITAELIRQWSSLHPEFTFLGRKFKIAVTGAEEDRVALRLHDIGVQIVSQNGETGYRIFVGGGMGRTPMISHELRGFLPKADLLPYLEACLRVYNLHGRRDNKYKARIKILVHETGIDSFREQVEAEFARMDRDAVAAPVNEVARIAAYFAPPDLPEASASSDAYNRAYTTDPGFAAWVQRNTFAHKVQGHVAATISLKPIGGVPGDATAEQMRVIADLAEVHSHDELRITHEQNIVLPHVALENLYTVYRGLQGIGLDAPNRGLVTDIIACPGLDYCALATARSIPVAQAISNRFSAPERQADIGPLPIKISGCINACGHHHVGAIGILGLDKAGVESYQITLGGDATETAALGDRTGPGFGYDELPEVVEKIVDTYIANREGQRETFLQTYRRIGMQPFKEALYAADRTGEIEDHWPLIADSDALPDHGYALVPLARLSQALELTGVYLGAQIPNHTDPDDMVPFFGRLGLISIDFPSFADGRGFSIATCLRDLGFAGRLRAEGPVISDQFSYLLSCGFDEVNVPEDIAIRQPLDHWMAQLDTVSLAYQRRKTERASVLDQRRAAAR